jgi:hypothetical protein
MKCISKQINLLRDWAKAKGVTVEIKKDCSDYFYINKQKGKIHKKITIEKRPDNRQFELFYLLHEIGHLITYENKEKWRNENLRYTVDFSINEEIEGNKDWYLIANITEEHDAWRNGKLLARELNIPLNEKAYEAEWIDAIKDYVVYSANKIKNR